MKILHTTNIQAVDDFDIERHRHGALFYIGIPMDLVKIIRDTLLVMGAIEVQSVKQNLTYNGEVTDWVDSEWFYSGNPQDILTIVTNNALDYSLACVDFKSIQRSGWLLAGHTSNNHSFTKGSPTEPVPLGLGTPTPTPWLFQGFTGPDWDTQKLAISIHTSPETPFLEKMYCDCDLELRTAAVCYITKNAKGQYVFGTSGAESLCRLDKEDLAGYVVSPAAVGFLRTQDREYQFRVALVARAWRNYYDDDISADIFSTIIYSPSAVANDIGFTEQLEKIIEFHKAKL